jgi:hypothetical protein
MHVSRQEIMLAVYSSLGLRTPTTFSLSLAPFTLGPSARFAVKYSR